MVVSYDGREECLTVLSTQLLNIVMSVMIVTG